MTDPYPDDWESRRRAVLHRAGYKCQECGVDADDDVLHVDHIKPISSGGGHEINNLQSLCPDCHADKHDKQRCNICHKIAHHYVDESKTSGSVGLSHLCREHYRQIAARSTQTEHEDNGSFGAPSPGKCALCGAGASGKYALHDHGTRTENASVDCVMCLKCRLLYVSDRRQETREVLQERMASYTAEVAADD